MEQPGSVDCGLGQLARPPRGVPLKLRHHLLSRALLEPSVAFCLSLAFCLPCLIHLNLLNAWRLGRWKAEVQGMLTGCGRQTDLVFSFRYYEYMFRLPDGIVRTGTSFGNPTAEMEAAHLIDRGVPANFAVVVEYDPSNPRASRIRGTSAANISGQTLWPLIFPGFAFIFFVGRVAETLAKIRMLRNGVLACATITAYRHYLGRDDEQGSLVDAEEYRKRWRAENAQCLEDGKVIPDVPCTFTFHSLEGQHVQACDTALLDSRPGGPLPVRPAVYDPASPGRARLLENLGPGLCVSAAGGWNSGVQWGATCRRYLLSFAFLLAPVSIWTWLQW